MKKLFLLTALMSLLSTVGAQAVGTKSGNGGKSNGCKQQANVTGISTVAVDEFAKRIGQRNVVLLDVRGPKEYAEGHLEGARNVEWGNGFEDRMQSSGIKAGETVAVYCRAGRRSMAAAKALTKMGYRGVNLDGGIMAWRKAGKPVVK